MPEFHLLIFIMPEKHGQLKEDSIGPSKASMIVPLKPYSGFAPRS
jgi:hypothetical protein